MPASNRYILFNHRMSWIIYKIYDTLLKNKQKD